MELETLKIDNEPCDLVLLHPATGEKTDVILKCVGMDSDDFKEVDRRLAKKRMLTAQKAGNLKKVIQSADFDEVEEDDRIRLAACVKGWENLSKNGAALEFTKENVLMVLKDYPWIREQIEEFVRDRANFIKA